MAGEARLRSTKVWSPSTRFLSTLFICEVTLQYDFTWIQWLTAVIHVLVLHVKFVDDLVHYDRS